LSNSNGSVSDNTGVGSEFLNVINDD